MTALVLPRYTVRGPDARTLARTIANHLGIRASWEVDINRSELVIDLFGTDPVVAAEVAHTYLDAHQLAWEIR